MCHGLDNFKEITTTMGTMSATGPVQSRACCEPRSALHICVRYAGDEFIVVLSGCGADEAEHNGRTAEELDDVYFEARPEATQPSA